MSGRAVTCPKCRASSRDGDTFSIELPIRGAWTATVGGVNENGELMLDGAYLGYEPSSSVMDIHCDACRYSWPSRRPWIGEVSA